MLIGCERRPEAESESSQIRDSSAAQLEPAVDGSLGAHTRVSEAAKLRSKEDPVEVRFSLSRENVIVGDTIELLVVLGVDTGFEICSLDAVEPKIPTILELYLPTGFTAMDEWTSPTPVRSFHPEGASVYRGEAKFRRKVQVSNGVQPGDYPIACAISYQACNSRLCLRPTKVELGLRLAVSH